MISHEFGTIFIHIPKTAGTSVEAALGHHTDDGVVRGAQDHRSLRQLQWPHGGVGQLMSVDNVREAARAVKSRVRPSAYPANRSVVDRAQFRRYFKFAVVRNPWARAYSWYRNVDADPQHRRRLGVPADISFPDFVEHYTGTDLIRPQTYWLVDFRGRIGVDLVCRFESLERDWAEVCRRAALPELELPHLNAGEAGTYLDAYDEHTRLVVAERYRREIELFDYSFAP